MNIPRTMHTTCLALSLLAIVATTACGGGAVPDLAAAYVSSELVAPGGGPARGRLEALLSQLVMSMSVGVSGLAGNADYEITVDGVAVSTFSTDPDGSSLVELSPEALGLDPREQVIAVREPGGAEVLVLRDPGATSGGTVLAERAPLAAIVGGAASATFFASGGVWTFEVEIKRVDPGDYVVWIDGTPRATIDAASGAGAVEFSSAPGAGQLLLDFDPRVATIEVLRGDEYIFAGSGHAQILGIDMCVQANRSQSLLAEVGGNGVAALSTRADCRRNFRVRIDAVPMGTYEVVVDDVVRGVIEVGEDENGFTEGELVLTSTSREGGQTLDFDPRGAPIEVRQGAQRFFYLGAFAP